MDSDFPPLWNSVPEVVNKLSRRVIGSAIDVHNCLGPGLFEKPYKIVFAEALRVQGLQVEVEKPLALQLPEIRIERAYVADLVIEDCILIELKVTDSLSRAHIMQAKTYVRLGSYPLGLLVNFGPRVLEVKRVVPD